LFASIAPEIWEQVEGNPVRLLGELGPAGVARALAQDSLASRVLACAADLDSYMESRPGRMGGLGSRVAYFSAEFGITEALPIYSGGLGILAGDHLESASDLALPLVGVGLLYRDGYF